jgi:uncharacterized protein (UPF0261 family)
MGTFDTKGEEHLFIQKRIMDRGLKTISVNVGTKRRPSIPVDIDLYDELVTNGSDPSDDRDRLLAAMVLCGQKAVQRLHRRGEISGIISAGGGTGTYLCSQIMHILPLDIPKVLISTVASRDMSRIVGTSDIAMFHSVADILGINGITGRILDRGAAAVCAMAENRPEVRKDLKRVALSFFGFITPAAENIKRILDGMGYEVVSFHANGTGGMAMVKLAAEGYFSGILDLATHELADCMMGGYCGAIGPERFGPIPGRPIPRLIVPGGMDCAVLEFTRANIPEPYKGRKIFFYDFRSAIRLTSHESALLACQLAEKLNQDAQNVHLLVPIRGFSEADRDGAPLHDPATCRTLIEKLKQHLSPAIVVEEMDLHINDSAFAVRAAMLMDRLIRKAGNTGP